MLLIVFFNKDKPESTATKTATATATGTATSIPSQNSSSKSTKVAVIAGSTVGGVIILGASVILAAWLIMRQRRLHGSPRPSNGIVGPVSPHSDFSPSVVQTPQKLYVGPFLLLLGFV
jgi:hypothetical protein